MEDAATDGSPKKMVIGWQREVGMREFAAFLLFLALFGVASKIWPRFMDVLMRGFAVALVCFMWVLFFGLIGVSCWFVYEAWPTGR